MTSWNLPGVVRACLAVVACLAAGLAGAQAKRWTVDRVLELSTSAPPDLGDYASQPDLQEIMADREYLIGTADLNDDGQKELIAVGQTSAFCGSGGCFTLVLTMRGGKVVPLFRNNLAHGGLAITREKANGYRGLAVVDENGKIRVGDRPGTPYYGQQLVEELGAVRREPAPARAGLRITEAPFNRRRSSARSGRLSPAMYPGASLTR